MSRNAAAVECAPVKDAGALLAAVCLSLPCFSAEMSQTVSDIAVPMGTHRLPLWCIEEYWIVDCYWYWRTTLPSG